MIQNENALALEALSGTSNFVTFLLPDKPAGHYYLFDSEFEGYDYVEKNERPLIGRQFKVAHRIDELRERLSLKYGKQLDYNNPTVYEDARLGVQAIYDELKIDIDFPRDLESFIGTTGGQLSPQRSSVLTVYADANYTGSELCVETAPHTLTWNYGSWNCYTMAVNRNLTLEFQTNGNNWNDCISSKCFNYINGADGMAVGFYKDEAYDVYSCGYNVQLFYSTTTNPVPGWCYNMLDQNWVAGPFCGHMNDQISSIKIKAIWQGCPIEFNDMF